MIEKKDKKKEKNIKERFKNKLTFFFLIKKRLKLKNVY